MVGVFSPAHDGAAVTLSNALFHLARRPEEWAKLRAEILPTKDEPITYELIRTYKYVENTLRESECHTQPLPLFHFHFQDTG